MQSHEDPPPPYPGTESNVVTSKGAYKGVPVYEIGTNDPPVYGSTTYQPARVILAQPTMIQARPISVGSNPVHCFCPQCHQQIITRVDYESGSFAWLMCLLLAIMSCVPCCLIPFCARSCQDVTHTCPHCSTIIGRRKIL